MLKDLSLTRMNDIKDQAARNAQMKAQLAHSKLQQQVNEQTDRVKRLETEVQNLKQTVATLIRKLGPSR